MSKWIRSYRDLPMRLNQWCNVVRWEATDTRPFLRTREFLWQEGHTAHASEDGSIDEMEKRLDQYAKLYEQILAIPVLKGKKPEHDKFPGAKTTITVEALMPDGKSIQGGTSHNLGQRFAKAFDITYEDENQERQHCYTASWGLSTRIIGALVMAHGDNEGLVLPPEIAPIEVVVVPIFTGDNDDKVEEYAREVEERLDGFRSKIDADRHRTPGWKFNQYDLKGVPLRIEVGPREVENQDVSIAKRTSNEKQVVDLDDMTNSVEEALEDIQIELYEELEAFRDDHIAEADSLQEILGTIGQQRGYVKAAWCGKESCEERVKEKVHADIVMVPFEDDRGPVSGDCAICGEEAVEMAYFAKNY
jgi:prolyl-tRNA synthetase